MTLDTYEQAANLVQAIAYNERAISILETMLDKFDDPHTVIDVTCKGGPGDIGLSLRQYQLPELREALQKALERFRATLHDNQKKLEEL